jgi:hypothetical protein
MSALNAQRACPGCSRGWTLHPFMTRGRRSLAVGLPRCRLRTTRARWTAWPFSRNCLSARRLPRARMRNPVRFRPPGGGQAAFGYEATILADLCDAVLLLAREAVSSIPSKRISLSNARFLCAALRAWELSHLLMRPRDTSATERMTPSLGFWRHSSPKNCALGFELSRMIFMSRCSDCGAWSIPMKRFNVRGISDC